MKKILVLWFLFSIWFWNTFAYDLTEKDNKLLNKIYLKLDKVIEKKPNILPKLEIKIENILEKLNKNSKQYELINALWKYLDFHYNENKDELDIGDEEIVNDVFNKKDDIYSPTDEDYIKIISLEELDKKRKILDNDTLETNILIFDKYENLREITLLLSEIILNEELSSYLEIDEKYVAITYNDFSLISYKYAKLTNNTSDYKNAYDNFSILKKNHIRYLDTKSVVSSILELQWIISERNKIYNTILNSDNISKPYYLDKWEYTLESSYMWSSNFIVQIKNDKKKVVWYVINEIWPTNENFYMDIEESWFYYFDVNLGYSFSNSNNDDFTIKVK